MKYIGRVLHQEDRYKVDYASRSGTFFHLVDQSPTKCFIDLYVIQSTNYLHIYCVNT